MPRLRTARAGVGAMDGRDRATGPGHAGGGGVIWEGARDSVGTARGGPVWLVIWALGLIAGVPKEGPHGDEVLGMAHRWACPE